MTRASDTAKLLGAGGTVGGAVTSNSGVVVDNITIDGTEIDLSSGNLTIDVAGQLVINSDSGQVVLQDDTVNWGNLQNSSGDFVIESLGTDKDMIFKGLDGGSGVTALTLDMSDAGTAIFNHDIKIADNNNIQLGAGADLMLSSDGTNGKIANLQSNGDIIFSGNDGGSTIEAARFDMSADGAFCIGATSQVGAGVLGISFNDSSVHGIDIIVEANASGAGFLVFRSAGGGVIGQINRNGTSNAVQYTTSSDYRLKENVNYDFDATTTLKKLKPCEFNWISDEKNTTIAGFIAHEVQSVVPNAVNGEKDETEILKDADGKEQTIIKPQGLDKSDLVPLLTKALQEQQATIEALTARITALESA